MKFNTNTIQQNVKTISSLDSDFVYFDVPENKIYLSSDNQALKLNIQFEDVAEDEKVFVIGKADFLHIISFADEVEIKSDYSFIAGDSKGKFESNPNYLDVLDSIKIMFSQSDTYEPIFDVDEETLRLLTRGSIFVRQEDQRESFQNLNIQSGNIFSSSVYRVYINSFPKDVEAIIHANVLKFIFQLGLNTKVLKNKDSFLLENGDVSLYFASLRNSEFIPILAEKFQKNVNAIYETTKVSFELEELKKKLEFISFYAKKNPSGLTYLKIDADNKVTLSVNESNAVTVECRDITNNESLDENFCLPFNSLTMLEIISKLSKGVESIDLYASRKNESKLFILSFDENEKVILTKINVNVENK